MSKVKRSKTYVVIAALLILVAICVQDKISAHAESQSIKDLLPVLDDDANLVNNSISNNNDINGVTEQVNPTNQTYLNTLYNKASNISNSGCPAKFDLRNCDLYNTGEYKNYVTSVKFQGIFATCWAFSSLAASETSILSKLNKNAFEIDASNKKHDNIDLSEHHSAWFAFDPVKYNEDPAQTDEGIYSTFEAKKTAEGLPWASSERFTCYGAPFSALTLYSNGIGPVLEANENYPNLTDIQKQTLYRGKNGTLHYSKISHLPTCYAKEDDWSVDPSLKHKSDYKLKDAIVLPSPVNFEATGFYNVEYADAVTMLMKEQLMEGRALDTIFHADDYDPSKTQSIPKYINPENGEWAHYTSRHVDTNHCVTIVGWDDDYSIDNFLDMTPVLDEHGEPVIEDGKVKYEKAKKPEKNGAWICKNSCGSNDSWGQGLNTMNWGYQNSGYFYLSYYDQSLGFTKAYDFEVDQEKNSVPEIVSHHDNTNYLNVRNIYMEDPVFTTNVFVAEQDQILNDVGFYVNAINEINTINVYLLDNKDQPISEATMVDSFQKQYNNMGFHKETLSKPIELKKGQCFAVGDAKQLSNGINFIMLHRQFGKAYIDEWNKFNTNDYLYCKCIVNPSESYLYCPSKNLLADFYDVIPTIKPSEQFPEADVCIYDNFLIKAYSQPKQEPQHPVQPSDNTDANNENAQVSSFDSLGADTSDNIMIYIVLLILILVLAKKGHRTFC